MKIHPLASKKKNANPVVLKNIENAPARFKNKMKNPNPVFLNNENTTAGFKKMKMYGRYLMTINGNQLKSIETQ